MSDKAALRRAMEAALVASPDDLATHMAYADLLTEMGDPRGELVAVQLALEGASLPLKERQELLRRERALLEAHQGEWLGELAGLLLAPDGSAERQFGLEDCDIRHSFLFLRGWLAALHLYNFSTPLSEALGRLPTARLLSDLTVDDSPEWDDPGYAALARAPFLDCLRRFQLGPADNCHTRGEGIAAALANMPRLEELRLYAHAVELDEVFALPMPNLRLLHVYHVGEEYPLEVLARNASLTNLTELELWPHAIDPGDDAYIQPGPFRELCFSPHLKSLRRLAVQLSEVGDDGVRALIESGLLARLRVLDLHNGTVSDEGAAALAASPDIRHLVHLRISQNQLTDAGIDALLDCGVPSLEADRQHDPRGIAHQAHLWEGDME